MVAPVCTLPSAASQRFSSDTESGALWATASSLLATQMPGRASQTGAWAGYLSPGPAQAQQWQPVQRAYQGRYPSLRIPPIQTLVQLLFLVKTDPPIPLSACIHKRTYLCCIYYVCPLLRITCFMSAFYSHNPPPCSRGWHH